MGRWWVFEDNFLLFLDGGNHKVLPRWENGHTASFVGGSDGLGEVVLPAESQVVESLLIQLLALQVRSSSIRMPRNRNVAILSADPVADGCREP